MDDNKFVKAAFSITPITQPAPPQPTPPPPNPTPPPQATPPPKLIPPPPPESSMTHLFVEKPASGKVTSTDGKIDCPPACDAGYPAGGVASISYLNDIVMDKDKKIAFKISGNPKDSSGRSAVRDDSDNSHQQGSIEEKGIPPSLKSDRPYPKGSAIQPAGGRGRRFREDAG